MAIAVACTSAVPCGRANEPRRLPPRAAATGAGPSLACGWGSLPACSTVARRAARQHEPSSRRAGPPRPHAGDGSGTGGGSSGGGSGGGGSSGGGSGGGSSSGGGSGGGGSGGGGSGGGGSGGGGSGGERHPRRALAWATLKWTAVAGAASAALLAGAPYTLSHPLGLRAALAVANLAAPASVSLQLDRLEAGWQRPLQLHGLAVVDRSGGGGSGGGDGAPFDPTSSEEEEEAAAPELQPAPAPARRRRRGLGQPADGGVSGAPAAEGSGGAKRRRTLVSVERVRTTQTLWQLLRGERVDVIVSQPQVDCSFNAAGTPRLLAALQQAGLVPAPHPPPKQTPPGGTGGAAAGAPAQLPPTHAAVAAEKPPAAAPAAAAAAAAPAAAVAVERARAGHDSSDSDHEEHPLPSLAEAAAAAAAVAAAAQRGGARLRKGRQGGGSGDDDGGGSGGRESGASAAPKAGPAAAAQGSGAGVLAPAGARGDDSSESEGEEEEAAYSAAQRSAGATSSRSSVTAMSPVALLGYMAPARPQRQQPAEPGAAGGAAGAGAGGAAAPAAGWLPESLQRASAAVALSGEVRLGGGSLYLSDGALLVPSELRELLGPRVHFEVLRGLAAIEEAAADEAPAGAEPGTPRGSAAKELKWARQRPAVLLPWGTGMPQAPVSVRLDSPTMQFKLQGWQTARGFTYLHRPVEAAAQLTPALCRYLFAYLHPALGGAVGLRSAAGVRATLSPHDGLWPTSQATLRVEPLSVELGESPVLRRSAGVLALAAGKLNLRGSLRAELSPLQATLSSDGRLTADRLDIRVGLSPWKGGLHLVSWGSASLRPPQALDATVCIPGDALAPLGLPPLAEGAGLPLHIGGTPTQPTVDVAGATKALAVLVARRHAAQLAESHKKDMPAWLAEQLQAGLGSGDEAAGVQMPPPLA